MELGQDRVKKLESCEGKKREGKERCAVVNKRLRLSSKISEAGIRICFWRGLGNKIQTRDEKSECWTRDVALG